MNISYELFREAFAEYHEISIRHMAKCIGVPHPTLNLNVKGAHKFNAETWLKVMAIIGGLTVAKDKIIITTSNNDLLAKLGKIASMPLYSR